MPLSVQKAKRRYQPIGASRIVFEAFLAKCRRRGELILPPERALCEMIGCSRGGLRALLDKKLLEGSILKVGKSRSLSLAAATGEKISGRLTFVAMGNLAPANPAWNKLWCKLSQLAPLRGIALELLLIPMDDVGFDWKKALGELPELLVLSTMPASCRKRFQCLKGKRLISTESHVAPEFGNVIALDNHGAGKKAASMLASRGYARPAMICDRLVVERRPYSQYQERVAGFREGCAELGLDFPAHALHWVEGQGARIKLAISLRAGEIARGPYDSIFLHTDNDIDFLLEGLRNCGKQVPRDLGIVTVNSFDYALNHHPSISSVAHGTEPMADEILKAAKRFHEAGRLPKEICFVEPGIHEGKTLRDTADAKK